MINRTSLISSRLQLFKFKTQEKQEQPKEQSNDQKSSSQEQKQVQASAQEILSLQNSIFLSMYKQQTANLNQEKQLDTNNNSSSEKNTQPSTNVSSENNFFLTQRTINLDDLIPEPKQPELKEPNIAQAKTRSSLTGGYIIDKGTDLANEFTSIMSQLDFSTMPSQMANGLNEFLALIKDQEQYNTVLNTYADCWLEKNNVIEITKDNAKEFMRSFMSDKFNINVTNLAKMAGGAALLSIASQIVIGSAAERFPQMAKDIVDLGKDFYGNLFKGNISDSLQSLGKIPSLLGKWTVKGIKSLAKNTYNVVIGGIVKPVAFGVADAAKTSIIGSIDTIKTFSKGSIKTINKIGAGIINGGKNIVNGFANAGKKLLKGNLFGAIGSTIGGIAKGAGSIIKGIANGAVSAVKTIGNTIGKAAKTVGKAIGKVGKAIGKGIKKIFKGW